MSAQPLDTAEAGAAGAELTRDHRRIDGILDEVRAILDDGELERAEYVFAELAEALRRHVRAEETILFPRLERHPMLRAPVAVMGSEHRRLLFLAAAVEHALIHAQAAAAREKLEQLAALLAAHNQKEERVLYPRAEPLLDAGDREALVREIHRR